MVKKMQRKRSPLKESENKSNQSNYNALNGDSTPEIAISEILDQMKLSDPALLPIFDHPKKKAILELLIQKECTLKDIRDDLGLNPGTIHRILDELSKFSLVNLNRTQISPHGIVMKFYRATAKKYHLNIHIEFPSE